MGIVRLLAEVRKPLGVAEVSQATGLPPATAHRLLVTLVEEGWVDQDPQSTQYELGTGVLGTAAVALAYSPFIHAAKVTLGEIAELSGLNTYVGVLVGRRVAYLASASGGEGPDSKFRVGVVEQAHATADGKVLLAYMEPQDLLDLYEGHHELRGFTPQTIKSFDDLQKALAEVRKKGYALDHHERMDNQNWVAVPVRGRLGKVIAAIVAGGPDTVATLEKINWLHQEMRVAAEQLSIRLGFVEE